MARWDEEQTDTVVCDWYAITSGQVDRWTGGHVSVHDDLSLRSLWAVCGFDLQLAVQASLQYPVEAIALAPFSLVFQFPADWDTQSGYIITSFSDVCRLLWRGALAPHVLDILVRTEPPTFQHN